MKPKIVPCKGQLICAPQWSCRLCEW